MSKNIFIDESFGNDAKTEKLRYSELGYSLEPVDTGRTIWWTLTICSTSTSELEGSEDGVLQQYQYNSEEDAEHDIELFNELTDCDLQRI